MVRHQRRLGVIIGAAAAVLLAACSSGATNSNSQAGGPTDTKRANVDPTSYIPDNYWALNKGPNGEAPATASALTISAAEAAKVRAGHYKVGIVMQTMDLDWSTLQVRGIKATLKKYGVSVIGVTDANFKVDKQVADIANMVQRHPDAIISIPVDPTATASAYKKVSAAGIKLVFILQAAAGLKYPQDYQAAVGDGDVGNGEIAAKILADSVPKNGVVGVVGYGVDFATTNLREQGFRQWMAKNRPDIKLKDAKFLDPTKAGDVATNFLTANPNANGLWVAWDAPAMQVAAAEHTTGTNVPIVTMDLGTQAAVELGKGGAIVGDAAQRPYDEGVAEAQSTIKALIGEKAPPWTVVKAVPVIRSNVLSAYEQVWHVSAPKAVTSACASICK